VQARTRIEAAGASVVLVAYHDPELLMSMMLKDLNLPFVLLIDPTREAYRRWGLGYGSRRFLWSPILIAKALGLALRGIRVSGTAPDEFQFGADFVIDAAGCVALQHRLKSYHDRTPIDRLLQAAHGE
jgi:peroxiredoxin